MLAIAGVAVGVMSEILVGSITEASASIGLSPFFVGVIVVAIVGNAAEHWVAIYFATRDKMDLSVNIAIGSSAQIALFAAPVLVLLSLFVGDFPLALVFNGFELAALVLAVLIAQQVVAGGRVDLVRGPPAARRLRGAGAHVLLRLMILPPPAFFSGPLPWLVLAGVTVCFLWVDLHFFARGREPTFREGVWWSLGWLVVSLLAARRRAGALGLRRRDHLHDRLLHRALAVARQPVRLHPALRVLRRARGAPRAAAVLGHRGRARAARPRDPRRRRADRAVPLRHLRARRDAARARLPDPARRERERRPGPQPDGARRCGASSRSRASTTARAGSCASTTGATSRRCSSAWPRSSPPTSPSRSTRSRRRSRSRATPC